MELPRFSGKWKHGTPSDLRRQMIGQTNHFLNWAMSENRHVPRIPRRKVADGGYAEWLRQPGARALAEQWWNWILDLEFIHRQ